MIVTGLYIAVSIAKKVEDRLLDSAWDTIQERLSGRLGRVASPIDATPEAIRDIAATDPAARLSLERVGATSPVMRRAALAQRALVGAHALWVDDQPDGNRLEAESLKALGVRVSQVETGADARDALRNGAFDLILSDIARPGGASEGLDDLNGLKALAPDVPVIFYILHLKPDGVPPGAFGITARPDELLHLCMDALERRRL